MEYTIVTLSCKDISELVDDFLEHSLSLTDQEKFEGHLACCETCLELVNQNQAIIEIAKTLKNRPLPSGVSLRLREALKEHVGYVSPVVDGTYQKN